MEAMDVILNRRSVRKYQDRPVEWDKIGQIIEAGRNAPCAGNIQNWKFIIVVDPGKRKAIAKTCLNQHWMATVPVHIVILADPDSVKRVYGLRGERLYSVQNCANAATSMLLAGQAQGLAGCWVGAFDEGELNRIVGGKDEFRPQVVLTFGYGAETPDAPPKSKFDTVAFINSWWGRIKDINQFFGYTSATVQDLVSKSKDFVKKVHSKLKGEDSNSK